MNFDQFKLKYQKKEVPENENNVAEEPMVSVCVQTYQHAPFIRECLDGILMQKTDFPFEILLGEDASNDDTREICMEYAEKYPEKIRLFLHHRENNISIEGTPTGRFNFMYNLFSARGEYIALCEGDDYWTDPLKLQKQVDFLENNPDYVLTHHDASIIDAEGQQFQASKLREYCKKDFSSLNLQKGPFLLTLSLCYRNKLEDFPSELFEVLNADKFLISILGHYGKGKYMPNVLPAVYRVHDNGMWSSLQGFQKQLNLYHSFTQLANYHKRTGKFELRDYFLKKSKDIYLKIIKRHLYDHNYSNYKKAVLFYLQQQNEFPLSKVFFVLRASFEGIGSTFKRSLKHRGLWDRSE